MNVYNLLHLKCPTGKIQRHCWGCPYVLIKYFILYCRKSRGENLNGRTKMYFRRSEMYFGRGEIYLVMCGGWFLSNSNNLIFNVFDIRSDVRTITNQRGLFMYVGVHFLTWHKSISWCKEAELLSVIRRCSFFLIYFMFNDYYVRILNIESSTFHFSMFN